MKFSATIDSIHYDPKKGTVKILLVATSYVSIDNLASLAPKDEDVQVTLESKQTKIGVFGPNVIVDEEGAKKLKEAARLLRDDADPDKEEEPGDKVKWLEHDETLGPEGADTEE